MLVPLYSSVEIKYFVYSKQREPLHSLIKEIVTHLFPLVLVHQMYYLPCLKNNSFDIKHFAIINKGFSSP